MLALWLWRIRFSPHMVVMLDDSNVLENSEKDFSESYSFKPLTSFKVIFVLTSDYCKVQQYRLFLTNALTEASVLVAKHWKSTTISSLEEWMSKVKFGFLMGKLSLL